MHETLKEIKDALDELETSIEDNSSHNTSFGIQSGNWSFPGVTSSELQARVSNIRNLITTYGSDKISSMPKRLATYPERIKFLSESTVPQIEGNAQQGVSTLLLTLDALENALHPNLNGDPNKDAIRRVRNLNNRLRSREAQLDGIAPKLDDLDEKIKRIENAHSAADQLPTDLQTLEEARANINDILTDVQKNQQLVVDASHRIDDASDTLEVKLQQADLVLNRCETAYSAATSVGLAAAFSERSKSLGRSVWIWTIGLILALGIAGWLGVVRIGELASVIADPSMSDARTALQFLLSVLTVGAPIWFAWLSTRQIGQRFRLAEDYAFKASVSQAYEGFRREAARVDPDMEQQLLGSALARLDEQPLRLVEIESHSSPINELVTSRTVQRALNTIPNFAKNIKDMATARLKQEGSELESDPPMVRAPAAPTRKAEE